MLTNRYKEMIGAQEIWDKLKRLIHRKVTLTLGRPGGVGTTPPPGVFPL